jgi:hypothetical protein
MWKEIIYNPWSLAIGGPLATALILWIISLIYSRLKRKVKKTTETKRDIDEHKKTTEYVAPLILIIDEESRYNISYSQLGKVVKDVYKEKGFDASVLSYSRTTGRLEIKNGNRKEIVSPLIGKLVLEFKIKSIILLN